MADESQNDYDKNASNNFRLETVVIINCALNAPLMLISVIGNTLVLAAILRTPSLRLPTITLLCCLAVSDLLVGLVVQPLYIANRLTANSSLHQALAIIAFAACAVSLWTMTAISVDRFLALHYHMLYPNLMTTHRAIYTSVSLWLVAFLLSFLTFWSRNAFNFASSFSIVICLFISNVCYIRIYRVVRRHQLQIHVQQQAVESNAELSNQDMPRLTKSAKNTFIYYIVMILSYTPLFTSMSILAMSPNRWTNVWNFADTVAFMNSSINPFLYCWRLHELRTAVIKTARQMLCKQTEGN
ncbi:melanocyte-stimulating hormone receptor-like [Oculina patagonica]